MSRPKFFLGGALFYALPFVFFILMLFFGVRFAMDMREYHAASSEYAGLKTYMAVPAETDGTGSSAGSESSAETAEASFDPEKMQASIDFTALRSINPDFAGVIFFPALDLEYPVVRSHDNADYLHKTFEGQNNAAGCIFMDQNAAADLSSLNTILYGHNMKDGSMFGSLKKLRKSPGMAASDPYIYMFTEGGIRCYHIFAAFPTTTADSLYEVLQAENYGAFVKHALESSNFNYSSEAVFEEENTPRILTLSTCAGRSGGNERFVVMAAEEATS